jgi:hypothetical protein
MMEGCDHGVPPEVIAPSLFFTGRPGLTVPRA